MDAQARLALNLVPLFPHRLLFNELLLVLHPVPWRVLWMERVVALLEQRVDLGAALARAPVRPHDGQAERLGVHAERLAEEVALDCVWLVAPDAGIVHFTRVQHGGLDNCFRPQDLRDLEQSLLRLLVRTSAVGTVCCLGRERAADRAGA